MKLRLLGLVLLALPLLSSAQLSFIRWDGVSVVDSVGEQLNLPWVGGMNSPQFSEIDLNFDGIQDLFIFDRQGGAKMTFLNNGTSDTIDYVYAPEYEKYFPENINFMLLEDYNCDEKADLFMQTPAGMSVWKNTGDTVPNFELVSPLLMTIGLSGPVNLYVSQIDKPALEDIDEDGDLDVVTFGIGGTTAEYNQNMSMDSLGHCDSLYFVTTDYCWGKFSEDFSSNNVTLGISCKTGKTGGAKSGAHAGSAIECFDLDGDKDKEALLGDFSFPNVVTLTNGGDTSFAQMTAVDTVYPFYDVPVDIQIFPAPYYLDMDNDGLRDLIVAPNTYLNAENAASSWFYKNVGRVDSPFFSFQTDVFLQGDMIDVGSAAIPVFFDHNDDGKMDMIVSNFGYFVSSGNYSGMMALYENVGSTAAPSYKLITRDYGGFSSLALNSMHPTFGDLDGDGDQDMMIGETNGWLHYFTNTAGPGNPAAFTLTQANYDSINVGQFSAPQLVDVDRDNLLDLLIGERNGNLNYYRNTGTASVPSFTEVTDTFGGVDVRPKHYVTGYSSPFLAEMDTTGQYYLVVGSENGQTFLFGNIDGNLGGTFTELDTAIMNLDVGTRSTASAADLDGDGIWEVVIGNERGGVTLLTQTENDTTTPPPGYATLKASFDFTVFPSPARDKVAVILKGTSGRGQVALYDLTGRQLRNATMNRQGAVVLNTADLAQGMYIVTVTIGNEQVHKKLSKL